MRNLTAGNKMKFTMFTFIVIVILAIIIGGLMIVLGNEKEKYQVESTAFIYDSNYDYIELENAAVISKKWTGNYYLKENTTKKEYKLGENVVSYDANKKSINLYGTFYQVLNGGDIKKLNGYNKVNSSSESRFYKIADRKYLIVADSIYNDIGSIDISNYLIIVMDKSGNALLLNNQIDVKTINEIKLTTKDFTFDVANEKLIFNNEEINLKKIIGSTNEYVAKEEENVIEEEKEEEKQSEQAQNPVIISGGGTTTNIDTTTSTIINNSEANNSQVNNSQVNNSEVNNSEANNSQSSTNSESSNNKNNNSEIVSKLNEWTDNVKRAFEAVFNKSDDDSTSEDGSGLSKSIVLNKVDSGTTHININYTVNDPDGEYNVVYVKILEGTNLIKTISLDKNGNTCKIEDLKPGTNYTIEMGYRIIYSNATTVDAVEDSMVVKTNKLSEDLKFIKVTSDRIYYNLKLDGSYIYGEGSSVNPKIRVYINDSTDYIEEIDITSSKINSAITASGYTGYIDNDSIKDANYITIKLEDTYYNGSMVKTNLKAKMVNY